MEGFIGNIIRSAGDIESSVGDTEISIGDTMSYIHHIISSIPVCDTAY